LAPKVTRPSGRNLTEQHPEAVVATRFKAQCFDLLRQIAFAAFGSSYNDYGAPRIPTHSKIFQLLMARLPVVIRRWWERE